MWWEQAWTGIVWFIFVHVTQWQNEFTSSGYNLPLRNSSSYYIINQFCFKYLNPLLCNFYTYGEDDLKVNSQNGYRTKCFVIVIVVRKRGGGYRQLFFMWQIRVKFDCHDHHHHDECYHQLSSPPSIYHEISSSPFLISHLCCRFRTAYSWTRLVWHPPS